MKNLVTFFMISLFSFASFAGVMVDGEYWGRSLSGNRCLLDVRPPTDAHMKKLPREEGLRFIGFLGGDNKGRGGIIDQIVINPFGKLVEASMICEDPFEPVDLRAGMSSAVFSYYCLATAIGSRRLTEFKIFTRNGVPSSYKYSVDLGNEKLNLDCVNLKKKIK